MKVVSSPDRLRERRVVLSIGNFDGVHLGHRRLLERMRERAVTTGLPSVVLTFFPPARVLFGGAQFLSSAEEKLALLATFDPTATVLVPFDHDYARTDSTEFLSAVAAMEPDTVIVGENFRFGHGRAGTIADLAEVTDKLEVFNLQRQDGGVISSSRIRDHLQAGRVEQARTLLGAPYRARGKVVPGDRRGRTVGFPTANIEVPSGKALPLGVFAVTVAVAGGCWGGMANVGPRPSFPEGAPALEVHLFDFDEDIYGRDIEVDFVGFVREQRRFDGLADLQAQLTDDAGRARELLSSEAGAAPC